MKVATKVCIVVLLGLSYSLAQEIATTTSLTVPSGMTTVVDCGKGQSLNGTLAGMKKDGSATVLVKGTCTEYVRVTGFEDLTLKGMQGAALVQPSTIPEGGLILFELYFRLHEASPSMGWPSTPGRPLRRVLG